MVVTVLDPILIKIDADIEGARRKLVQLKKEVEEVSSGRASAEAQSRFNPRNVKIRVPEDLPRSRKESPARPSLRDGLGALAREGATAFRIGDVIAQAMKRSFPVISGPLLAMDVVSRGISRSRSTTLGPVLDRFHEDVADLEDIKNLSPEKRDRGGDQLEKKVEKLERNINDAVVSIEEALKKSVQGIQALRRPNDGAIPKTPIGTENVNEFRALADSLRDISQVVKDPKLQQQIEGVLERQEFIFRTGRDFGRVRPDGLGRPLIDERINPSPLRSGALGTSPRTLQFAGLGTDDADATGGSLLQLGGNAGEAARGFLELNQEAGRFAAQGGSLAELLGRTNVLFGEQSGLLGQLGVQVPELGESFSTFLARTSQEAGTLNDAVGLLGQGFIDAFEGAIQRGESLSDVLKGLALDLARLAAQSGANALIGSLLGGLFSGGGGPGPLPDPAGFAESFNFAKGAAFAGGRSITAFASGGVLTNRILRRPTLFPLADGIGLAGEAGPEAILPLARMGSGELGVKAAMARLPDVPSSTAGDSPVTNLTFNIDATGADEKAIRRVERLVQQAIAAINHDRANFRRNVIGTVLDNRRRGGSIAGAFGGR